MRRSTPVLFAVLMAAVSAVGLNLWLNSRIPPLESLTVVEGRVLQPAGACRGARYQTFVLTLLVGDQYRSLVLSCDERLRTAAVGGTQVVLRLQAEESGPSRWHAWMAGVDGREVIQYSSTRPLSLFDLGAFVVFILMYLPIALAVAAARYPSRRPESLRQANNHERHERTP
jgi:hypothetical protein